ncbi:MAG TPA: Gfo/Idh/MocA family oxidoreductase [Solirubrobacteraceae bacterium]|jgi:predicted dehydrogenase|nr:Gfo/Idh/MocA family oxidoreductase [Solirubrobacteraceae bacterium]
MKLRWGLLSTASINDVILKSCGDCAATEFVAVASRELERARTYAQARGIARAWGSYRELLEDPTVDAVYVSVPNGLHMQWVMAALAAGKHVLCEKPLSRHEAEIAAAYEVAERANLVFGEAFMYRHHPQTDLIVDLVASGAVGELRTLLSTHTWRMPLSEYGQRLPAELDAGSLMDNGSYQVGMSRLLAGNPVSVSGAQVLHATGVDMRFAGTLRFRHDVIAQFDCGMDLPWRNRLEIVGADASLILDDPWHCRAATVRLRDGEDMREIPVPPGDPYRLEFEAFARAVDGEHVAAFDKLDALAQARVITALYESAELGRDVSLPDDAA